MAQRKNLRAYGTRLYAKLFFSANKVPNTDDDSNAYFRREVIISFPRTFEGKADDVNLIYKLTTEAELSGIFNLMMSTLRNVLKNKVIYITEKTIEQRRAKHELAVDPIGTFVEAVIAEDSIVDDRTLKDSCYNAYIRFCKNHKIAIGSKETLGKTLKTRHGYKEGREASGERRLYWKGMKLTDQYRDIAPEQQTL
jgi:phage/plasmid-associated DNA primase